MEDEVKKSYPCLTAAEYAQIFSNVYRNTNGKIPSVSEGILLQIKDVIQDFEGSIDLLSIGAGLGSFERDIQTQCKAKIRNFMAIEPNEYHVNSLKGEVLSWNIASYTIHNGTYETEKHKIKKKFDVVLMAAVLYYISDPSQAIIDALSYLKPGGKVVAFLNPPGSFDFLVEQEFWKMAQLKGVKYQDFGNHSLSTLDVCPVLDDKKITYTCNVSVDYVDRTKFIERINNDCINFCIQTKYEKLAPEIQHKLYWFIKEQCKYKSDGRWVSSDDHAMIVASN